MMTRSKKITAYNVKQTTVEEPISSITENQFPDDNLRVPVSPSPSKASDSVVPSFHAANGKNEINVKPVQYKSGKGHVGSPQKKPMTPKSEGHASTNRQLALKHTQILKNLKSLNSLCVKLWVQHVGDQLKIQASKKSEQNIKDSIYSDVRDTIEGVIELIELNNFTLEKLRSQLQSLNSATPEDPLTDVTCPAALLENNTVDNLLKQVRKRLLDPNTDEPDLQKIDKLPEVSVDFKSHPADSEDKRISLLENIPEEGDF